MKEVVDVVAESFRLQCLSREHCHAILVYGSVIGVVHNRTDIHCRVLVQMKSDTSDRLIVGVYSMYILVVLWFYGCWFMVGFKVDIQIVGFDNIVLQIVQFKQL